MFACYTGARPLLRVQILLFWHTKFSKRIRLGSPRLPPPPLREILDPPLKISDDRFEHQWSRFWTSPTDASDIQRMDRALLVNIIPPQCFTSYISHHLKTAHVKCSVGLRCLWSLCDGETDREKTGFYYQQHWDRKNAADSKCNPIKAFVNLARWHGILGIIRHKNMMPWQVNHTTVHNTCRIMCVETQIIIF